MPQVPSTRWCPTPEQLMILEEMYRSGVRTPNASQIQQITAHLSYYGKIEGKNVFYWFQNHKARDRQKLRRRLSRHQQMLQQHQMMNQQTPQLHQMEPFRSPLQQHQIPHQITPQFLQQVVFLSLSLYRPLTYSLTLATGWMSSRVIADMQGYVSLLFCKTVTRILGSSTLAP